MKVVCVLTLIVGVAALLCYGIVVVGAGLDSLVTALPGR